MVLCSKFGTESACQNIFAVAEAIDQFNQDVASEMAQPWIKIGEYYLLVTNNRIDRIA